MHRLKKKTNEVQGITLIALVVSIVVLLILAGISIQMLTGDNGIIKRAMQAKNDTDTAGVLEDLKLKILEYQTKKNLENKNLTLEDYLRSEGIDVIDNDDGTLSVTYNGKDFIINKTTYTAEVDNKPKFQVAISEPDSNNKVAITVTISNAGEFSTINSIKLTNANKDAVVGEKTDGKSTATFEVDANGDYKVEVKATKGETKSTGTKLAQVNNITVTFGTSYGTIEIVWLKDTGKTISSTPNAPYMYSGFQKVAWKTDGTEFTPTTNSEWFEYKAISGTGDNKTSRWANAKNTADGSYFVWIPRFAYRIVYWDKNYKNVVGYYDGRGMVDVKGNVKEKTVDSEKVTMTLDPGVDTVTKDGIGYIVHPAFDNSINNGGWSKKISGFWVAKYEMSREDYDSTLTTADKWKPHGAANNGGGNTEITDSNKASIRAVSKPNVTSWRNITIGNCYANSYGYDRAKESHLMKNSEWGAVAYLTHSKFGRNGTEVSVNQCTGYITGAGRGIGDGTIYNSTYDVDPITGLPSTDQQYDGSIGLDSSSTGNINGVYDLSGGAFEYVAAFDGESNELGNGWAALSTSKASTPYATAYSNGTSTNSGIKLYKIGKVGDATKEVYNGSGANGWLGEYSFFVYSHLPFFLRGGRYNYTWYAGVFCSYYIGR